jgi:hypothetical protein
MEDERTSPRPSWEMKRHLARYLAKGAAKTSPSETPGPTRMPKYLAERPSLASFHRGQVAESRRKKEAKSGFRQSGMSWTFFQLM